MCVCESGEKRGGGAHMYLHPPTPPATHLKTHPTHPHTHTLIYNARARIVFIHTRILIDAVEFVHSCEILSQGRRLRCKLYPGSDYGEIPVL